MQNFFNNQFKKPNNNHITHINQIMKILLKNILSGENYNLEAELSDPTEILREKVSTLTGVPSHLISLIFGGKKLLNGKALSNYNFQPDSSLYMVVKEETMSNIELKTLTGNSIKLSVHPFETVEDLKYLAATQGEFYSHLRDELIFLYKGKKLENDKMLSHYNIGSDAVINIVVPLRSGKNITL